MTAINIKMNSGAFLRTGAGLRGLMQVRNRSVQNWKRPSMDEYGVPVESWSVVNARTQKKYNSMLAVGLMVLGSTLTYCYFSKYTVWYGVPRHLIDLENDRLLINFEPPNSEEEEKLENSVGRI